MPDMRTYADRRAYMKAYVSKRRKRLREQARVHMGGKCMICGYDRCLNALDFHHRDPKQKDFELSEKGMTRSWKRIRAEMDKCVLICANCHREIHAGITQLPKATLVEKRGEFGETLARKRGQSRAKPIRKGRKV